MTETLTIAEWLYGRLVADPQLAALVGDRVFSYVAPAGSTYPLVLFSLQGGHDVSALGAARVMMSCTVLVKAVDKGSTFARLRPIASRLDQLLQGASGQVWSGSVLMCVREQPIEYVEVDDGVEWRHLGGLYRVVAT